MKTDVSKFFKFLGVAEAIAALSKDPSRKVGAIALDDKHNIIATGYNGFPRKVKDLPERYNNKELKYKFVSHAEMNLVAQAAYGGRRLDGATVIITELFPCSTCTKLLIQAGIIRIITNKPNGANWTEDADYSKIMLHEAEVEVIYIN